eukprot:UN11354
MRFQQLSSTSTHSFDGFDPASPATGVLAGAPRLNTPHINSGSTSFDEQIRERRCSAMFLFIPLFFGICTCIYLSMKTKIDSLMIALP